MEHSGRQMPPLEEYLAHVDKLAQDVIDAWALNTKAGHAADLSLVDKTGAYRTARQIADNHRKHKVLSEHDEAEEKATRLAFAKSYKTFYERRVKESNQATA